MRRCAIALCSLLLIPALVHADAPAVVRLEIHPAERTLHAPHDTQQLAVIAHFSDGSKKDVTHLTAFKSSDGPSATVQPSGRVRFHQGGEVAILCRYHILANVRLRYIEPAPGFVWPKPPENNLVDHLTFAQLKRHNLAPAELCSDEVFLRRAYLDVCGILPAPRDTRRFLDDRHPLKRSRLIDELLARPEYAECWAHHWVEILGLDRWQLEPKSGAVLLHWFRGHHQNNTPLDEVVRDLLRGKEVVSDHGPVGFYSGGKNPEEWAELTARAFLGVRPECVSCHVHTWNRWTPHDRQHWIAFFGQLSLQKAPAPPLGKRPLFFDRTAEWLHPETKKPVAPRFFDGANPKIKTWQDRREVLADWVTAPKNPLFARTMANRIWYQLLGQGIARPPEAANELPISANDELLDALAQELVAHRFDVKHLIRVIMNSRTYQLQARKKKFDDEENRFFSHTTIRPLKAELLLDMFAQITEVAIPYDKMPLGTRAVHLVNALPPWMPSGFSQPQRLSDCPHDWDTDRRAIESFRAFHMMVHGSEFQELLKDSNTRPNRLLREKRNDREILDELLMASLLRMPDDRIREQMTEHMVKTVDRRRAWEDALWAVIATKEFFERR